MEFIRVQDFKTNTIKKWFVDKKEVLESTFSKLENIEIQKGHSYNTSYSLRNSDNDFIHVHHYN